MRGHGLEIIGREKDLRNIRMEILMKETFIEASQMVKAYTDGLITTLTRVSGIKD